MFHQAFVDQAVAAILAAGIIACHAHPAEPDRDARAALAMALSRQAPRPPQAPPALEANAAPRAACAACGCPCEAGLPCTCGTNCHCENCPGLVAAYEAALQQLRDGEAAVLVVWVNQPAGPAFPGALSAVRAMKGHHPHVRILRGGRGGTRLGRVLDGTPTDAEVGRALYAAPRKAKAAAPRVFVPVMQSMPAVRFAPVMGGGGGSC